MNTLTRFSMGILAATGLCISASAAPNELLEVQKTSLAFQTFIRVEMPARVVEAEDTSILGESSPFVQSLSYGASKETGFRDNFTSEAELNARVQSTVCQEIHDVEVAPFRENGTRGTRRFRQKIRPFMAQLSGIRHAPQQVSTFSITVICKSPK